MPSSPSVVAIFYVFRLIVFSRAALGLFFLLSSTLVLTKLKGVCGIISGTSNIGLCGWICESV